MASTIAAITTSGGGVVTTADSSGNLSLLSGATTVVAVTATGVAVTGTLSSSGASTFTGTGKFATTIGVGNATPSASGSGITFPATQSASSDANTLDDYEEGTWTPSIGGTATYSGSQNGVYTKVGRVVNISFDITINVLGTGSTTTLSGLPFAQGSVVARSGITIAYYVALNVSTISIVGIIDGTASSMFFSGSAASATGITDSLALFKAGARIIGSGTYITAT